MDKRVAIYGLTLIFFVLMMDLYQYKVGGFADESVHIAYIAYLEQENTLIPNFYEMPMIGTIDENNQFTFSDTGTNYLGHPPLYYQLMRLSPGINSVDGEIFVNVNALRDTSQLIAICGLLFAFYIGYSRLSGNLIHLLYATIVTSVPMMAYNSSGVTNDSLVFLFVNVTLLALIRLTENKQDMKTFALLAVGVCGSVLTKLTGGLVVAIACILVFGYMLYQDRNLSIVLNKYFLITLPLYIGAFVYFANVFITYGTVQPTLSILNYDYMLTTGFYVPEENRISFNFLQYIRHFKTQFIKTWTGIASHIHMLKTESRLSGIALKVIMVLPVIHLGKMFKKENIVECSFYVAVGVAVLYQFYVAHSSFIDRGYLGNVQSRYYLCALPAIAFCICKLKIFKQKPIVTWALISLLIYENYIYFLLNYENYLY
ncbi:MAG: hypothetical protein ATN35_01335 [Epulopiscium sp. Nele67-Bin004]|nr:MAG: hypothetical protein ATN35_01335 [Epulopiscium sp. Nele67-Bin004]